MMPSKSTPRRSDFDISIICALPLEAHAVQTIFEGSCEGIEYDGERDRAGKAPADKNAYTTGKIGHHDVVLAHMPGMGVAPAAAVASDLKHSFGSIKLTLLVGVCGGVPIEEPKEIKLGDVIIGKQVIQYDFGKQYPDGFKRKDNPEDSLGRQNPEIRAFVSKLESEREDLEKKTFEYLTALLKKPGSENTINPYALKDELFRPGYWHKHHKPEDCNNGECNNGECNNRNEVCEDAQKSSCEELKCDRSELDRCVKLKKKLDIHFGSIASGNKVMKSGEDRDLLAGKENIIAFDMEGAGAWDYLPCIVVKGVCDYADSHKNKKWQEYAAVAAAACTKAILEEWTTADKLPDEVSLLY